LVNFMRESVLIRGWYKTRCLALPTVRGVLFGMWNFFCSLPFVTVHLTAAHPTTIHTPTAVCGNFARSLCIVRFRRASLSLHVALCLSALVRVYRIACFVRMLPGFTSCANLRFVTAVYLHVLGFACKRLCCHACDCLSWAVLCVRSFC
jgi:hypothetical protein